jgi:high-affinity iron transporter
MMDEEVAQNDVLLGLGLGLGVAGFLIYLLFKTSVKLPLKQFFRYSSYFIILIVAGLVSLFVKGLQAYEYIPTFIAPLYDSSFLFTNDSMIGKVLGALVGYDAQPSLLQVVFWFLYVGSLIILFQRKKNV